MAKEIERKFLTIDDAWRKDSIPIRIVQGYISKQSGRTVRIRLADDHAFLTVKGPTTGITRNEFEYRVAYSDGRQMLDLCSGPLIHKVRHLHFELGSHWEVDEFLGDNEGLIVAEIELEFENDDIQIPDWIGEEVTHDRRYTNSNLVEHPFKDW